MTEYASQNVVLDGKHKQLIDLNKNLTCFESKFLITPHTLDLGKAYQIAVVSQDVLDSDNAITYKTVDGIYAGNVKNDDFTSNYQNYFLILKSEEPFSEMKIDVEIHPLQPPKTAALPPPSPIPVPEPKLQELYVPPSSPTLPKNENRFYIKLIIAFFVLVSGGFLLYYFTKNKNKNTKPVQNSNIQRFIDATSTPPAKNPLQNDIKTEIKNDIKSELKNDIKSEIRNDIRLQVKNEMQKNNITEKKSRFSDLLTSGSQKRPESHSFSSKSNIFKPMSTLSPKRKLSSSSISSTVSSSPSLSSTKSQKFVFED